MSRDGRVGIDWAGDSRQFRLAWGELEELQEVCAAGPYVVLQRLYGGSWRIHEIAEPIRLGLIGGGLDPAAAMKLVRQHLREIPPVESLAVAQAVLSTALMGAPDEPLGKQVAPDQGSGLTHFRTASSGSEPSTEPPLQ